MKEIVLENIDKDAVIKKGSEKIIFPRFEFDENKFKKVEKILEKGKISDSIKEITDVAREYKSFDFITEDKEADISKIALKFNPLEYDKEEECIYGKYDGFYSFSKETEDTKEKIKFHDGSYSVEVSSENLKVETFTDFDGKDKLYDPKITVYGDVSSETLEKLLKSSIEAAYKVSEPYAGLSKEEFGNQMTSGDFSFKANEMREFLSYYAEDKKMRIFDEYGDKSYTIYFNDSQRNKDFQDFVQNFDKYVTKENSRITGGDFYECDYLKVLEDIFKKHDVKEVRNNEFIIEISEDNAFDKIAELVTKESEKCKIKFDRISAGFKPSVFCDISCIKNGDKLKIKVSESDGEGKLKIDIPDLNDKNLKAEITSVKNSEALTKFANRILSNLPSKATFKELEKLSQKNKTQEKTL